MKFVILMFWAVALFGGVSGTVRDRDGLVVAGVRVELVSASGSVLAVLETDARGAYVWSGDERTVAQVRFVRDGYAVVERAVAKELAVVLEPASVYTRVTVNAVRGGAEDAMDSAHVAVVKTREDLLKRPLQTVGNVLDGEPGVLMQQSSPAQVSPFLRGLTGYQVLNVLDGIRYNNSTFRSGPNQYLAYVQTPQVSRMEVSLGPTGVAYGGDSLGGTIQVFSEPVRFERGVRGEVMLAGATADLSGVASAKVLGSNEKWFWLVGGSGQRRNDLRAGGGVDSRNAYTRFFGLSPERAAEITGSRMQDSGFTQAGAEGKLAWRPSEGQILTLSYQRGAQYGSRMYRDMIGGLGRLQSRFEPQSLDFLYGRYEKLRLGFLDSVTGTVSWNRQLDGTLRQNLNFTDAITRDEARVNTGGYSGQAATHWGTRLLASFGGESYDDRVRASREVLNPVTNVVTRPRPLYPDRSRYQTYGSFAQGSYDVTAKLRATAGMRYTGIRFATREDRTFGVPSSTQWFHDVTFQSAVRYQVARVFGLQGVVSRGFRAPNLNDLGALGINDLGYEVPSSAAVAAGALLSTDAGEGALSKGVGLRGLSPEVLWNYEFGFRLTPGRLYWRAQFFNSELSDPISRRTLLFPVGSVPTQLAGLAVTPVAQTAAQRAQGVVGVATAQDPRAVKAFVNDGRARYYGVETLGKLAVTSRLVLEGNYSYILGRDLNPNRNIRRLPPQMGAFTARYTLPGRRPWVEVNVMAAGEQSRLSGGDRDDERMGASFRRADIAAFFRGGRVGGVSPTGESLLEIQNRVLPVGRTVNGVLVVDDNTRVPLYLSTRRWATVNLRMGVPVGERMQVMGALENLLDRNYRWHGSGMDAAGFNAYVAVRWGW